MKRCASICGGCPNYSERLQNVVARIWSVERPGYINVLGYFLVTLITSNATSQAW